MNTFSISTIFKSGFHWGWRISIIYISFALSTLGFMFFSLTQKVDLVSDTYYKEELNYEKTIAAKKNSSSYVLPLADIPAGLWIVKVTWKHNNIMFYNEYRYTRNLK